MKKVISREYKVMLRAKRFAGDQRALVRAAAAFWKDFASSVSEIARGTGGGFATVDSRRLITFYDTTEHLLYENHYIFRERRDLKKRKREVTLKFRHEDRHVTGGRDMSPKRAKDAETKFEEDIKSPFTSLYSYSTTIPVDATWSAKTLRDLRRLFPGVAARIADYPDERGLAAVGGRTARELVLKGASFRIGKNPKVDAECALIAWYDNRRPDTAPVAVEFSFRYGNEDEEYGSVMSRRAYEIFKGMPTTLERWIDPQSQTKTGFMYR